VDNLNPRGDYFTFLGVILGHWFGKPVLLDPGAHSGLGPIIFQNFPLSNWGHTK